MAHLIIDGYNLTGTTHPDLERVRESLIDSLVAYKRERSNDVTVVFDGYLTGQSSEQTVTRGGVVVVYSRLGDRADDVIKRIVSRERKDWIVITSDRDIAMHAWAAGAVPVPSEQFAAILERSRSAVSSSSDPADGEADFMDKDMDDDDEPQRRQGNPHRPSKRDRALRRALEKL